MGKMAEKCNVKNYTASKYLTDENGIFTGEVIPMWDAKSKKKAIAEYCEKYDIDLEKSYAYGDTTGDFTMFKKVGNPVAINPAKKLLDKIKKDKVSFELQTFSYLLYEIYFLYLLVSLLQSSY